MWVAKIKFSEKGTLIGEKAIKHNINLLIFPLSFSSGKDWVTVHFSGTIFGDTKDKINFIKDLKKEERVIDIELNQDFIIGTIKEPKNISVYNKDIIHVAPAFISDQGYEIVNIASFKRVALMKVFNSLKKAREAKLMSIRQKKINSISIMSVHPNLTVKQKRAIELAIKTGYYEYPRKIELEKLAKLMKISYSTYQAHLRKAEKKLIPYFFEKA